MTKREREIIALIADGLSNKEIAGRLNIEIYTVKSHVHNILEKLALHSRTQNSVFFPQRRTLLKALDPIHLDAFVESKELVVLR